MAIRPDEIDLIWQYVRSVAKYWWLIVVGVGLTLLDFGERLLGTWWIIPPGVWLAVGLACAVVAQYLAYRDLRKASDERISEREVSLSVENEELRHGIAELEDEIARKQSDYDSEVARVREGNSREISRLEGENAKLKIKPYDEAQRQTIDSRLKTYSDTERDLLRFLMQRGETEGSLIYKASQDGHDICGRALERLGTDGMVQMREDMSQANVWRPRYYRVNPILDAVLRDALYPRAGTQAAPRFII